MEIRYLTLAPLLLLCSCSITQRVEKTMEKVQAEYAETKSWDELPLRVISWEQAIAMMKRNNMELAKLRDRIAEAERDELGIYTQMIPGLTYYGYFTSTIRNLTNEVNARDISSNVNVNFSIPTITQVPYRVYAGKAATFASIKALEGRERELTASLYRIVRTAEVRKKQEELQSRAPQGLNEDSPLRTTTKNNWTEMARILGDSSARWVIEPGTMPHVEWEVYEPKLSKLDQLIVCQFALRLEQARLAQYGVALRYLPTINTSLYSPSLFSSTGGTYKGTFLSSEDTRISFNVSYSVDTDMDIWNSFKRSQARYLQVQRDVSAQLMELRNRLQQARQSYAEYRIWKGFMQKRMEFLKTAPVDTADAFLERRKEEFNMEKELLSQEMQSIETEAALILQYGLISK